MTIVSSAMPSSSRASSSCPTFRSWSIIVSWYGDCQRPAWPMLSGLVCVRRCMWVKFIQTKNGVSGGVLAPDEVDACLDGLVVDRLHPLLGQRPGVLDALLADAARTCGSTVESSVVGRPGVDARRADAGGS